MVNFFSILGQPTTHGEVMQLKTRYDEIWGKNKDYLRAELGKPNQLNVFCTDCLEVMIMGCVMHKKPM